MSYFAYRNLLYAISETLDNSYNIHRLRFMCGERISRENTDSINSASQLFDELEREGHLGIENLDELEEILRELGEWGLLSDVIRFEIRRNELREPRDAASLERRAPVGVLNLKAYFMGMGVGAIALAALYRFCESTPTFFDDFALHVLVSGITLYHIRRGSVCFTVQAENLSALKALWDMYQDGALQKRLQEFLVTEEIKKLANGKEVEVTVSIDEQEYKDACLDLKIAEMEASSNKGRLFTSRRRNSDSNISLKELETKAMGFNLLQTQKQLRLERERTLAMGKEVENLRAKLVPTQSILPTRQDTVVGTKGTEDNAVEEIRIADIVALENLELAAANRGMEVVRRSLEVCKQKVLATHTKLRANVDVKELLEEQEALIIQLDHCKAEIEKARRMRAEDSKLFVAKLERSVECGRSLTMSNTVSTSGKEKKPDTKALPSDTDASQSIASGRGLESSEVGASAVFTVQTRDFMGRRVYDKDDQIAVVVTSHTGSELKKIEDNRDGTYVVTYTPDCAGQHDVVITVNGMPLSDCRWHIQVNAGPHQYQGKFKFGSLGTGQGQLNWPGSIAVSERTGNIAVSDVGNKRVQMFSPEGKYITEFGQKGPGAERLGCPLSVAFTLSGDVFVRQCSVGDQSRKIELLTENGQFIKLVTYKHMKKLRTMSVGSDGQLIVCDIGDNTIKVLSPDGTDLLQSFTAPECSGSPTFAVYHQDKFFVSYYFAGFVMVFDKNGVFQYNIGSRGTGNGQFNGPAGLVIDRFNHLIVCDVINGTLQAFTMEGTFVTKIEGKHTGLKQPWCVALSKTGHMFVTDVGKHCVHVFQ